MPIDWNTYQYTNSDNNIFYYDINSSSQVEYTISYEPWGLENDLTLCNIKIPTLAEKYKYKKNKISGLVKFLENIKGGR